MSSNTIERGTESVGTGRRDVGLAGGLLVAGFLVNAVSTLFHPAGDEDNHPVIFTAYATSDTWVTVHLGQFVGVLLALAGLLVLALATRAAGRPNLLSRFAAALTVATAATWALLQGLDGVGLKQAVDAWYSATGTEKPIRFAGAETVRWLEWGFQSYFRLLMGGALLLLGAAVLASRRLPGWLGWTALLAGVVSTAMGVDVGYSGLASELQDLLSLVFLVLVLVFAVGVLVTGGRERGGAGSAVGR
jgi:hypothetical protein